ncbi:MAG: SDR family oxidoreductase [Planctomycetota bacterium]|jgi:NAD(P)-dependent dehydrogenase (short-subunit alcohol dehydrogenase family)|nr:SDR family oxidoreductase [Planctomycetota bacterium]
MNPRELLTLIQSIRPDALARVLDASDAGDNDQQPESEAALSALLRDASLPLSLRFGEHRVLLAAGPQDLVKGAGTAGAGPLAGQVAVVSGAASGLGMGIAKGLYQAGAAVLFTDIDADGLVKVCAEMDDPARVHHAVVNVTDENSVAAGFDAALARFGRVDILACCAGVAPPYNLVDFPLDKFRFACEVNLTGYFLMGREAARIMCAQGHGGSMVMLSSKSGLEPSKANTAYNATKSGELHMARGWALELGGEGIRVNCIAPGNVFEGSKIWNPEYMKKAAEKKGIQPDEVIPYYNSLTALNAEIKPDDIANAAVFLCSDAARRMTGQVLVVDSGQVWTR